MASASHGRFILPPAVDPTLFAADIDAALKAFKAFLDAAVADQPNYKTFREAGLAFHQKSADLAVRLGIAGASNPGFLREAWWFNLTSAGLGMANITTEKVRKQIMSLQGYSDLSARLMFCPNLRGHEANKLSVLVAQAVAGMLSAYWWCLSDSTPDGVKVDDVYTRKHNAVNYSFGTRLILTSLSQDIPLQDGISEEDNYGAWQFNIYRLTLQLLGYQPSR